MPGNGTERGEGDVEDGVTELSTSKWSSPILVVPKPDGSICFCNDFRALNSISRFNAYPMPRIDELIERLGRSCYISTLDLTKGYRQLPLAPEDRHKTFASPSACPERLPPSRGFWACCYVLTRPSPPPILITW